MNARFVWLLLFATTSLCPMGCASVAHRSPVRAGTPPPAPGKQGLRLNYWLYLPAEYPVSQKSWPLILFLHGAGERGNNLTLLKRHGPPKLIAKEAKEFPFIIVSPQCPAKKKWTDASVMAAVDALLERLLARYRIDENRIYVTGLSMGGFGTWRLACRYPHRFAAIAPICGTGNPKKASAIVHVPVWAFYGARDNRLLLARARAMVAALKRAGGNVRFTVYPDTRHDAWTETYENPELYDWLLKHKRGGDP